MNFNQENTYRMRDQNFMNDVYMEEPFEAAVESMIYMKNGLPQYRFHQGYLAPPLF
jgi:hypothetical protein